jgi:hypothetical protein
LIFDNVDRDYHNKDNSQAYSVSFEIRLEFPSVHIRAFTSSTPFGNCIDEVGHMEALEGSQPATGQTEVVRGMHLDTFVSEENPFSINGKVCSSLLAAWRTERCHYDCLAFIRKCLVCTEVWWLGYTVCLS